MVEDSPLTSGQVLSSGYLDLLAGRVGRVVFSSPDEPATLAKCSLIGGDTWLQLRCHSDEAEAPDDDWLSIAETFELLLAER